MGPYPRTAPCVEEWLKSFSSTFLIFNILPVKLLFHLALESPTFLRLFVKNEKIGQGRRH